MASQRQSTTDHSRDPSSLFRRLPGCNPRRTVLGPRLRYFYGSLVAIRDGPFSGPVFATSLALQLQSATAHSRDPSSLLLWLPSCNPRRPILGRRLRYFYGSPAASRDGAFSATCFATSMAPQGRRTTMATRRTTMETIDLFGFFASGGTTMATIDLFWASGGTTMMTIDL